MRLAVVLLLGCGSGHTAAGPDVPSGVLVRRVSVELTVEPAPTDIFADQPDWLTLGHCGRMGFEGDRLVVYGEPDPDLSAVALVNYGGWGSLFSGGGSQELEVDLSGGPVPLSAALRPGDILYELSAAEPDTGVPGGERTFWYDPNDLPQDAVAREIHGRLPDARVPVVWREPLPCAR